MTKDSIIDFQELEDQSGEAELSPPEVFASHLIEWALERRASDLFVSDVDGAVQVSVRRLGKIENVRRLARAYGRRLQGHLRVLADADAGDTLRPVDGRGTLSTPDGSVAQLRLSALPTLFGQDVAIRLFDPVRGARDINQLGLDAGDVVALQNLYGRSGGLILVTGPVASGKSSTLYAMLTALNDGSRKIHAIEDPVEYPLSGVMQSQVNARAGLEFSELLTAVLRHSPDVIMIGEVRDRKTAETAIRAGASGQLVLATVHAKSAAEGVDMMLQYDGNHQFLSSALIGVVNQRLVRRLCEECRERVQEDEIEVPERIRSRLGSFEAGYFRAVGCESCFNEGFDSLVSMPEIMLMDSVLSEAISNRVTAAELESTAVQRGMLRMGEVALSYVLRGITTATEVNRVINDPDLARLGVRLEGL